MPIKRITFINKIGIFIKQVLKIIGEIVGRQPLLSFFSLLFFILILILISNHLTQPKVSQESKTIQAKTVKIYQIGSVPKVSFQGKIDKKGVMTVVSQTAGVVSNINVHEGQEVNRGSWLLSLASNYQGANAFSVQRQMAEKQYQNLVDTYDLQKDIIQKQRDVANKTNDNSKELRDISKASIDETKSLISLDQDIVNTLDSNLNHYVSTNSATTDNSAAILATKQYKSQYQTALNGLNQSLRSLEYQTDDDEPPKALVDMQKDLVLKQLDLQERSLNLSKEISYLQVRLATINESLMYPAAPFAGRIERIFVKVGQMVTAGTPLFILNNGEATAQVLVLLPEDLAKRVSQLEASTVYMPQGSIQIYPTYISQEPTDSQLFSIVYVLPDELKNYVSNSSYVRIDIPIGYPQTITSDPYVPIDAIYQSENKAYVYLLKKGVAKAQEITMGSVVGSYAEVLTGLANQDKVILDRNVIDNDPVIETR